MAHPGQIRKLTYEDYCLYPDDGNRHEILDGEHYMSPSPRTRHQRALMQLIHFVGEHVRRSGLGEVYCAPLDVLLSPYDVVQPDLIFISAARVSEVITEKNVQGAPDLLIEIISPTTQSIDEDLKRQRYEKLGVAEYWLVYPDQARVRVYRRADAGFGPGTDFAVGAMLASPLLPGLEIAVGDLFA
ncbi:MAG: Uma2 family endonuclease [Terriglobales bacterium]